VTHGADVQSRAVVRRVRELRRLLQREHLASLSPEAVNELRGFVHELTDRLSSLAL